VRWRSGWGSVVNAGHGLDYDNVGPIARIDGMNELNIGFSIIARAVFVGLETAVREMKALVSDQGEPNHVRNRRVYRERRGGGCLVGRAAPAGIPRDMIRPEWWS
jgi:hypothetical protein